MEITNCTTDKAKRDALLVKDALENGSQKAYSDLMRYYRDPLYYTLLKMMKNPYDAEDLTIEASFGYCRCRSTSSLRRGSSGYHCCCGCSGCSACR